MLEQFYDWIRVDELLTGFFIYIVVYLFLVMVFLRKLELKKVILYSAFYFYLCIVIDLAIFPIPISGDSVESALRIKETIGYKNNITFDLFNDIEHFLYNLVFFIPFGFLINIIFIKSNRFKRTICISFLLSFLIESIQLFMNVYLGRMRDVDINDLLANTLGGVVGLLIYIFIKKILKSREIKKL